MPKTDPTYAIIAAVSERRLETIIERARRELDVVDDTWQVIRGNKGHAAVWDFDPASDLAYELAAFVSRQIAGTVYLAQRHEHMSGCTAYEAGATTAVPESPETLAARLGVPFPEPTEVAATREWSVCVVEGVSPDEVTSGLELTADDREVVRLLSHPMGTIVFATDESGVLGIPSMLVGRAADATTYAVQRSHGEVLTVWIYRGGKIRLFFRTDDSLGRGPDDADRTWDIKGAKDAKAVVATLKIPPALLGW